MWQRISIVLPNVIGLQNYQVTCIANENVQAQTNGCFVGLNNNSPSHNTVKKQGAKGVQFMLGEHGKIVEAVVEIYIHTKVVHGIIGPIPVILVEDETKVKV